jgi:hypothetical protein
MTIALAVLLNVAAVAGFVALLTATMRLPFRFSSRSRHPRVAAQVRAHAHRAAQAQPRPAPQYASGQRSSRGLDAPEPAY